VQAQASASIEKSDSTPKRNLSFSGIPA
jgi:hypothetical protein